MSLAVERRANASTVRIPRLRRVVVSRFVSADGNHHTATESLATAFPVFQNSKIVNAKPATNICAARVAIDAAGPVSGSVGDPHPLRAPRAPLETGRPPVPTNSIPPALYLYILCGGITQTPAPLARGLFWNFSRIVADKISYLPCPAKKDVIFCRNFPIPSDNPQKRGVQNSLPPPVFPGSI